MRGKAAESEENIPINRITPAYAGKRLDKSPAHLQMRDHPRLCGEKCSVNPNVFIIVGSPPPMRGKGRRLCDRCGQIRITPAYAGKSYVGNRETNA